MCQKLFLSLFLLFAVFRNAVAQQPAAGSCQVRSVTTEDGLSHGYVTCLFQDSRGFVWIGTIYGLNRYDGYRCKSYTPNQLNEWTLHSAIITAIAEDQNGMLWLGTDNGLAVFNPYSEKFIPLEKLNPGAPVGFIRDLLVDGDNNIWCTTLEEGTIRVCSVRNNAQLSVFSSLGKAAQPALEVSGHKLPEDFGNAIRLFLQTGNYTCLLANDSGDFLTLDLQNKTFKPAQKPATALLEGTSQRTLLFPDHDFSNGMHPNERYAIVQSPEGHNFVCQFFEKRIFQLEPGKYPEESSEIEKNKVITTLDQPQSFARMVDRSGKLWVGTIGYGLRIIEPVVSAFQYHFPDIIFCNPGPMPNGKIWAGMYASNILVDLKTGLLSPPDWSGSLPKWQHVKTAHYHKTQNSIFLILESERQLELAVFDLAGKQLKSIKKLETFTENPVTLFNDSKGNLWVAGIGGEVIRYDCQTQAVQHWQLGYLFPQKMDPGEQMARCIAEDKKGRIWIGCDGGLIRVIHSDSGTDFSSYHNEGPNGPIFKSPWIFSICPHAENPDLLWLATMSGGLALFDAQNIKLSYLDYDNGINLVIGMVPDDEHNLWLATNKGIQKYLPAADMFVSYAYLRHIPKITLNTAAVFKDPSGSIIMGGAGLVSIAPHALKPQPVNWDLAVTDIQINRASATAGNSGNKVKFGRQHELSLHLTHDDRFLSIHLSVPAATIPEATIYRYRLTGLHKEWVFLGQNRTVELAGLAPGNYRLEVQAAVSGEPWAEAKTASIPISIAPPWYAGIPAYCVYMLLLATLIGAGFRYQRKRLSLQFSADFNQKELERLQDMDNFKNRFFAYIAHEFKTPLTIIMGAGEYLRQLHRHDSVREFPEAVIREGNNMLSLIHELIDITKLQDKSIEFRFKTLDIVPFMEKIIATWKPVADAAQIDLLLSTEFPTKLVDIDQTRMQYIINNLLANAIKHTPLKGNIYLLLENEDQNTIRIRVADSGPGIAPGDLPYIFEKYFRGGQKKYEPYQFGLGLSFVKELIELMGGEISVKSTFGEGAVFKILLPLRAQQKGYKDQQDYTPLIASYKTNMDQSVKAGPDAPQLLIVDDHPSIQSYLKQVLQPFFQLTFAKNGIEGLEFAIQQIPDLILTDVIMPVMDGITMTQQLKSNQLTNHIPVVILSSKNDIMDRLSGQEKGADAYLGKPFNDRELILTLHNLNRLQQLWKDRYKTITTSGSSLSGTEEIQDFFGPAVVSGNDAFMQSILDAFEKNFSSESFDAIQLAALLNVSKAQLYRKISKISDEGVMELLRNFRLQKAMGLLAKHPEISTKEVAFKVGFKEYSHFSASFKKCFGQPPSEWRKNNLNG